MFPPVYPLYWGLWFLAAPVLIHLINLLRHQRVEWAAMEFLLLSQKKHRTWVILKQLLLLLLRMAAIALVVLALARPLLPDRWGSLFAGQKTHHIVLLDDSFSMSENLGSQTAFEQAKDAIRKLGDSLSRPREPQLFSLVRFSRCGGRYGGTRPDFQKEIVDADFSKRLTSTLDSIQVSQTAAEPPAALEFIQQQLLGENTGERRIIYLLSDFRTRQWDKPDQLKKQLLDMSENHADIHLIDCVESTARPNLAISALEPEEGIRAAGVQWPMQVTVQNYGTSPARRVPVYWSTDDRPGGSVTIDVIPPRGTAEKEFYVKFDVAGEHRIAAHLTADAVEADNQRYAVVDLPVATPVLLVDSQPAAKDALRVADSLTARKGIQPEIVSPDYLARPKRPLSDFALICVTNFGKIERSGVEALEEYVKKGGGVFFATGPFTRGEYVTRDLYRNGEGLFPLPLERPQPLVVDPLDNTPDVQSEEHFVFRNMEHRVENLSKINVKQYFATTDAWIARPDPAVKVILRLRNRAPLLVEKNFYRGRVLAFLSTTTGNWNNWSNVDSGAFVGFVLNMVPYLSHRFRADEALRVGEPKTVSFTAPPFDKAVRFSGPGGTAAADLINGAAPDKQHPEQQAVTYTKTDTAGFYQASLAQPSKKTEVRNFAVNVDAAEGDLLALAEADLASRLAPLKYDFAHAARYDAKLDETEGRDLGDIMLYALVAALALEQLLAWSCGYHVAVPKGGAA